MENKEYQRTLVFAAKNGNEKSFAALYAMYYEKIYALALTTLKNAADAEDALQMCFMRAWQSIHLLENIDAFNTWIQRIALNECYSILRKKNVQIPLDDIGDGVTPAEEGEELELPQAYAERRDLNERLKAVIDHLSDVQRQTVMLYYFSEMSVEEVAQVMECSVGTVKSRLFLARRSIKTEIEELERRSGERFYGVMGMPMLPFVVIFTAQVKSTLISRGAAAGIIQGIIGTAAGASGGAAQIGTNAVQASAQAAKAAGKAGVEAGTKAAAKVGTKAAAAGAKAALSKKIVAISLAAVVAVGGAGGTIAYVLHKRAATATTAQSETSTTAQSETTAVSQESAEKEKELKDAELGDMEEPLKDFFAYFFWTNRQYDCESFMTPAGSSFVARNSLHALLGYPPGVDFSLYPVQEPIELSGAELEAKQNQFGISSGISEYDKQSVYWVAENIYNMKPELIDKCVEDLLNSNEPFVQVFAGTGDDGKEKYYVQTGGVGGNELSYDITDVKTDGEKYYIKFDIYWFGTEYENTYFALMEVKHIDGKDYWSVYKVSEDIPEDIFS